MNESLVFNLSEVETKLEDAQRKLKAPDVDWSAIKDIERALTVVRCEIHKAGYVPRSPMPVHQRDEFAIDKATYAVEAHIDRTFLTCDDPLSQAMLKAAEETYSEIGDLSILEGSYGELPPNPDDPSNDSEPNRHTTTQSDDLREESLQQEEDNGE